MYADFDQVTLSCSRDLACFYRFRVLHTQENDYDRAIADYDRAVIAQFKRCCRLLTIVVLLMKEGQRDQAIADYKPQVVVSRCRNRSCSII